MKSKLRFTAYLLAIGCFFLTIIPIGLLFERVAKPDFSAVLILLMLFFVFIWIWLIFGELRTKTVSVSFDEDRIIVRGYLGLGKFKVYHLSDISGFKTSVLSSRGGSYEYLYLMVGNKKIAKLSAFYHSNYKQVKGYLVSMNIKFIGVEYFSNRQELKDIFAK